MSSQNLLFQSSLLRQAALSKGTQLVYNKHLNIFLTHIQLSLSSLLSLSPSRIDSLLSDYFEYCYRRGGSYDYCQFTYHALIYSKLRLKGKLLESKLRLYGWSKVKKSFSHPPITWELTLILSVTMAKNGYHMEAMGILLAFHCYLRVGELTRLTRSDITLPNDSRLTSSFSHMALRLAVTKTGREQFVTITDPVVKKALCEYLTQLQFAPTDHVFQFSAASLRQLMHRFCTELRLPHIGYVPHSFRHGGATADCLANVPVEDIMIRGRWRSLNSCNRYIQTGRALLLTNKIPKQLYKDAQLFVSVIHTVLTHLRCTVPVRLQRTAFKYYKHFRRIKNNF